MILNKESDQKLYQQVFNMIRGAIESGPYRAGMRLPSIRALASELECSRNTVETAYRLLVQEGYVASCPGSGHVVQNVDLLHTEPRKGARAGEDTHSGGAPGTTQGHAPNEGEAKPEDASPRYDFTYGNLQTGTFPANAWRTITNDLLLSHECASADKYSDPLGEMELREEIARQLNTSRDIPCRPEQIVIQGGTEASVSNLLTLFDRKRDAILMEDPGYVAIRETFLRNGFTVVPVPVEQGTGIYLKTVDESGAKLAYVTPSSQFPTCQVMGTDVRTHMIEWAEREGVYILEDDYCREFRYQRKPIPSLASMACPTSSSGTAGEGDMLDGRVIYMGTFSKALSPSLRINYLVLPKRLLERWRSVFAHTYSAVPWLSQAVLARFMRSGQWDRHLRRLQATNRRKYEKLTNALHNHMGQRVSVREKGTGLHMLVDVRDGRSQEELIAAAAAHGVRIYGTAQYCMLDHPNMRSCVMIGFSAIEEKDVEAGVEALAEAWFGH